MTKNNFIFLTLLLALLTIASSCFVFGDKHGRRTSRGPRFPHDEHKNEKP
jgi:hypothetical protein